MNKGIISKRQYFSLINREKRDNYFILCKSVAYGQYLPELQLSNSSKAKERKEYT